MAKRSQTGATALDQKPITYEDFLPSAQWSEDQKQNILTLHLPGFTKEQINITCVRSIGMIRVHGERELPNANKKWSRFNQSFKLPSNCNVDKIQAKWQNEILMIIMPKVDISSPVVSGKDAAKTSQETENVKQEQATPNPAAVEGNSAAAEAGLSAQKPKQETRTQKVKEETPPQLPQVASTTDTINKQAEKGSDQVVKADQNVEQLTKKETGEGIPGLKKAESKVMEKGSSSSKSKEFKENSGSEKEKEKNIDKDNKSGDAAKGKDMKEVKGVRTAAMKAVKGLTMENKEERQAMINMGVAVLLLVGVGAYVSYRIGSRAKEN